MMQIIMAIALAAAIKPVPGDIITAYDPPAMRWQAGHRGVDLAGYDGQNVKSMDAGTVSFVGKVAGKPVVVVTHGQLRSTYEPVVGIVAKGQQVKAGQVIGVLIEGHKSCQPQVCLHLGLKRGDDYLNPVLWKQFHGARLVGSRQRTKNVSGPDFSTLK